MAEKFDLDVIAYSGALTSWIQQGGSALTAYAAGTGDWAGVVTAFVDGWAAEAALAFLA